MNRPLPWIALVLIVSMGFAGVAEAQYKARPIISSVDPAAGPPGAKVRIIGKNFGAEYKVYYNGVELKPVSLSASQIVVKIPKNAVQGRFTLKGPIHQVVSPQVFWVVQSSVAPVISEISPSFGPPGTAITIKGKHFSAKSHENAVTISGAPLQVRSSSNTQIVAVVPLSGRTGNITVQVYNAGQTTSHQAFTVLAQLKIDSFKPIAGPPGTKVTLRGSGFSTKKKGNTVTLGGKKCKILRSSASEIVIQVPTKGAQTGRFMVDAKGVGKTESGAIFPVAYPPKVTGAVPAAGGIGTEVVVQGAHFGLDMKAIQVLITGRACKVLGISDSEIRIKVPQGAVSGPVEVIVKGMGSAASKKPFEVWAPLAVTRMEPLFGLPGTEIRIIGTGFRANAKDHTVIIGNRAVKIDRVESGTLIFKIPKDAPGGQISLRLEVKDRGATMIAIPLQVMHSPEIDGFTPKRGPAGTVVTITGKHFGTKVNHVRVLLGAQIVQARAVTPTMIRLTVPPGVMPGKFEVQTVRRGKAVSKNSFETYIPVHVTNFLPSMGYAGQVVSLFGSGFETVAKRNKVTLGGKKLKVFEATSTRIKVKLPKKVQPGRFRVEVSGRGHSETVTQFVVVEKLSVKSFTPALGVPGTYVTIKGRGFANKGLRGYLGQKPMGVRVDSPTQVTIAVPPGSVNAPFVFTAPGAGRADSKTGFKVLTPLSVSSFMPSAGPTGTKVSIYGTGFELGKKKTKIYYGHYSLQFEPGSSERMLIVTIPKGAPDAPFKVSVKGKGETESENVFTVIRPVAAQPAPQPVARPRPVAAQPAPAARPGQPVPQPAPAAAPPPKPASMDDLMGIEKAMIVSLDPMSGPVGEVVTINGTGFGEDMEKVKAWVGQTAASVIGVVPDMVMIEVPANVKRGKIRIKVTGKPTITSKELFVVTE
ncbi:MAG: hypothetical protein GY854_05805 [Deltaproteobacteria bacterium]|nr:hypothetical protein [Deltaproteobacteria bacterium]